MTLEFFNTRRISLGSRFPTTPRRANRQGGSHKRRLVLESLEERALLSATLWTNQPDYAPGSTALINGAGFQPGEAVQFQVAHTDGTPAAGSTPWVVVDGDNSFTQPYQDTSGLWHAPDPDGQADGNLQTTWYVNPTDEIGASMQVIATGLSSGETAQATFTDAVPSPTNIGTKTDTTGATSVPVTTTAAVAQGRTVIVAIAMNSGSSASLSVADSGGNTYHQDASIVNASGVQMQVFSATAANALGSGATVTVTAPSGISDKAVQVSATSAGVYLEPADTTSQTGSGGSNPTYPTAPKLTTTDAGGSYFVLGVSGATFNPAANQSVYGNGSNPWSGDGSAKTSTATGIVTGYQLFSGIYAINGPIAQISSGANWAAAMLAYHAVVPTSTISAPTNNLAYNAAGWTTEGGKIAGTASDTGGLGITQVILTIQDTTASPNQYWNGSAWQTTATTVPISISGAPQTTPWSYNFTALTSAHNYKLTSQTKDGGGNTQPATGTGSTTSTFAYTTASPSATMTGLVGSSGSSVTNAPPMIKATLTATPSLDTVTQVQYAVDSQTSGPFGTFTAGTDFTAANSVSLNNAMGTSVFSGLPEGQHIVWVRAADAAGNPWGAWSSGYVTEKDTTAPTAANATATPSPTNAPPTIGATITAVGANNGISAAEYFVNPTLPVTNGSGTTMGGASGKTANVSATLTPVQFNNLPDGTHTVYVNGKDSAGNWSNLVSATFTKDMQIPLPTVAPPTIAAPLTGTNQSPIPFTVTFNVAVNWIDNSKVFLTNGTLGSVTGSGTTYTVNVIPTPTSVQTGEPVKCQILAGAAQNASDSSKSSTASNTAQTSYDTVAPQYSSATISTTPGGSTFLGVNSYVSVSPLSFNEPVVATGTPKLLLNDGQLLSLSFISYGNVYFSSSSVTAGMYAGRLDYVGITGGSFTDVCGNPVALPTPGTSSDPLWAKNITVNAVAPTVTVTPTGTATKLSPITFTLAFNKPVTGLTTAGITVTGGTIGTLSPNSTTSTSTYTLTVNPTAQGTVTCLVKASTAHDGANYTNYNTVSNTASVIYDTVAPTTTAAISPLTPNGLNGWYTSAVTVTLTAADTLSGVAGTSYSINGGAAQSYAGPFAVPGDGSYSITYSSTDKAGNVETTHTLPSFKIDTTAPTTTDGLSGTAGNNGWFASAVTVTLNPSDALSGVAQTYYQVDSGSWTAGTSLVVSADGAHTISYYSVDTAGNIEGTHTDAVNVDATAAAVQHVYALYGTNMKFDLVGSTRHNLPWQITGFQVVWNKAVNLVSESANGGFAINSVSGSGTNTLTLGTSSMTKGIFELVQSVKGVNNNILAALDENFRVLYGAVTDHNSVTIADALAAQYGYSNSSSPYYHSIFADVDGNGLFNATDVNDVRYLIGSCLPS